MKAKSRKRLLISSVAMLLVAMLALGTATFAWFTQSTSATADGITVRTSKTSSLQIASAEGEYGNGFTYEGMKAIMKPASSIDGDHWFYTSADNKDSYASTQTITAVTRDETTNVPDNIYVYAEQLNIKNAAAANGQAVSNIQITMSNVNQNYVRVAFVPVTAKGQGLALTGESGKAANSADFKDYVYDNGSDNSDLTDKKTYYPVSAAGALQTTTTIKPIATTAGSITIDSTKIPALSSLAAQEELHFNVYVWFEGQDKECYDGNAGTGVNNISFAVTGTPVAETNP